MKSLSQHITEKLVLNNGTKVKKHQFNYSPKTFDELKKIIKKLIKERGTDATDMADM